MNASPELMTAVERLGYRVTPGDVATHAGIHLEAARNGLLALANQTGGHMQVTDTGEIIYVFSPQFRQILFQKFFKLQVQAWLDRVWKVVFYLVKISFGILLIGSIAVVYLTILAITLAALFGSDGSSGDCSCGDGGGSCVLDIGNWSSSSSSTSSSSGGIYISNNSEDIEPIRAKTQRKPLNFLEAVFSVLFGDGNPNADLEQRRWSYIGNLIHRQHGVAIGEQIAPFLDNIGTGYDREYENYMLPVLTKFNGIPEVSPTGQLVYHFPDLQTTVRAEADRFVRMPISLRERKWKFTNATPTQRNWAFGLFFANIIGIAILAVMLAGMAGVTVTAILGVLALYGSGLIIIPFCRYFWVKDRDRQVRNRNLVRSQNVRLLQQQGELIQDKLDYAKQFAKQHKITDRDIVYTTEEDALAQSLKRLEEI